MDKLPDDVTHTIFSLSGALSGRDVSRVATVSKTMNRITNRVHPWLRKALSNTPCDGILDDCTTFPLFQYEASLQTYDDIEYWSRVCVATRNIPNGIHKAIRDQLLLREHALYNKGNGDNTLTREQSTVVQRRPNKQMMLLQAYAGTGKTTTLYHYAKRWPESRVLYLAYNRSLADESRKRFGNLPNVSVMTIHAMALNRMDPEGTRFTSLGNLKWSDVGATTDPRTAKRILTEFEVYCSTDRMDDSSNPDVCKVWNDMFVDKSVTMTHDAYLKEFQRSVPVLDDYDVIMLDEVQDCTDCILDIVKRQTHATRIFVGDVYQKIYGFRHVNEPFQYILGSNSPEERCECFRLSVSFRMGRTLMHHTNQYLKRMYNASGFSCTYRTNDTRVSFFNRNDFNNIDKVRELPDGTVVLCRYNSSVHHLMFVVSTQYGFEYDMYGKDINFEKEISIVRDLEHIDAGLYDRVSRDKLRGFRSIQEVHAHFTEAGNFVWTDRIRMYNTHGGVYLIHMWTQAHAKKTETNPRIVITTAHRSKGSEFDHVVIYDDFPMNGEDARNTLYVAMTRAKNTLYMNETLLNFYKRMSKPVMYVNDTISSPNVFKTCVSCNTMKTNMTVCSENDHASIMSQGKCEVYEYVPLCNICRRKHQ